MSRRLLSFASIVCLLLVSTVVVAQSVSFTAEAQPVPDLIKAINARFETDYATHGSLRSDVVCVQVTDVALSELLEKIAAVTASRWVNRNGTVTLEPSSALREEERRLETEYKRSDFERQLEGYTKQWQKLGIDPKIRDRLPLDRIAVQKAWTVEVYAVSPTRAQERLDRALPDLMITDWIKNLAKPKGKTPTNIVAGPYEDLHLVSRHIGTSVQLSLEATDKNGAVISRTALSLSSSTGDQAAVGSDGAAESKIVSLDPVRRAFAQLWSDPLPAGKSSGKSQDILSVAKYLSIDPSLRLDVEKLVSTPTVTEPLSVFVSPVLNEASRLEGRDFVALLPDSAVLLGNYIHQVPQIKAAGSLEYLQGSVMRSKRIDGWTLMTPLFPSQSRLDRMDRDDLRKLVIDVKATGGLDPIAIIAALPKQAAVRTDLMRGVIGYYDVGVAGAAADSYTREFTTYKALSTIPENVLRMAMSGNDVRIVRTSVATMRAANNDILNRRLAVTGAPPVPGRAGSKSPFYGAVSPPIEVTDLLANETLALQLQISPKITQDIQGRNTTRGYMQRSSLDMMAWAAANAERGKTDRNTDGLLVSEEFMLIKRTYWTITYRLPDGLTASTNVSWIDPDFQSGWRPFSSLGSAFTKRYNRAYQESMEKIQYMGQKGDAAAAKKSGGGKIPPPQ